MSEIRLRNQKSRSPNLTKEANSEAKAPKAEQKPPISPRLLARVVVTISLFVIFYYTSLNHTQKPITFARQSESLAGKGLIVQCSDDYLQEINKYEGCFPKDCGRYITDHVISKSQAEDLLKIAKKGLNLGTPAGGVTILDLHSGALSKGTEFININKLDEAKNVFTEEDLILYRTVKEKVKYAIAHHFGVYADKIFLTAPTFFTRLTSIPPATVHDEYWHPHVDKETYKSFHYTSLLYLNDYHTDFSGGRFVFIDDKVNRTVEPKMGRLSMFTSGAENEHHVERVTKGVRYAITISFTCDKKHSIEDSFVEKTFPINN